MAAYPQKQNQNYYIDTIHSNSKGWITKAEINSSGYKQRHYRYIELCDLNLVGENIYITLNTFFNTYRRLEYIKELNALYIDLDYYNTKFSKEQIIMDLEENYFNKSIPTPNFVIDSGRGMYLIWLINTVPNKALPLWKAVEEYLYNELKRFGADRQALDATRILRVPGSINSKSRTVVDIIEEYDYVYDLREIQHEFLPELKPYEKKKGRPKKVNFLFRERSLYYSRIQDIIKLCKIRGYDLKGHRELILFLYRYWLCVFTEDVEKSLEDVLGLNSMFLHPLREAEVVSATRSAEKCYFDRNKEYRYKNETLIELLEITEEEQIYMTTIISKNEYRRRKRIRDNQRYKEKLKLAGKTSKKEQIAQRRIKIKDLLAKGLSRKDICLQLNISIKTYKRDIQVLKEQEL